MAESFCLEYFDTEGIDDLVPAGVEDRRRVLEAFVLSKAVYEVGYELAHRPGVGAHPARSRGPSQT